MQTQATHSRIPQRTLPHILKGTEELPVLGGRRKSANLASIPGTGLPALKLQKKKAFDVNESVLGSFNLQSIYDKALKDARDYHKLARQKFTTPKESLSLADKIAEVCNAMKRSLEKENSKIQLSLYLDRDGVANFDAYYYYDFPDYRLFALPLQALSYLDDENNPLLLPMMWIFGQLMIWPEFSDWHDNEWLSYMEDMVLEQCAEIEQDEPENAQRMLYDRDQYSDIGPANAYLHRCQSLRMYKGQIDRLLDMADPERFWFLKQWIRDGYKLLNRKDRQKIQQLQQEELEADEMSDSPVNLTRKFIVCWNSEDSIICEYMNCLEVDNNEFGCYSPMELYQVGRELKPYRHNKWFDDFIKWLQPGLTAIERYCETKGKHGKPDKED